MPNWSSNRLSVSGDKEHLTRFVEQAKGSTFSPWEGESPDPGVDYSTDLDLQKFVPIPQKVLSAGFDKKGYSWCVRNWGTKWNIGRRECREVSVFDDHVDYLFVSAWAPPDEAVKAMAVQYPMLDFKLTYDVGGVGFMGSLVASGGQIVSDECRDMTKQDYIELGYEDDEAEIVNEEGETLEDNLA